ncbi:MAG TPA: MetS family NSS transporter small subunit [Bacteroidetes bacterium]|nr:MetS family NSS transporter small subunit [Bacteroidota bacterium]
MKLAAVIFMIVMLTIVWGGFIFLLAFASRREKN